MENFVRGSEASLQPPTHTNINKTLCMLPGPTFVPESVMTSMFNSNIYHRSEEFHKLFEEVQVNLRYLFRTNRKVFILTSSGTGGLEAIVSNFLKPGNKVLVIVNGYFSEELSSVVEAFKGHPVRLNIDWDKGITIDGVEQLLKKDQDIKAVALAYVETSTGARAPLKELGDLCQRYNVSLIVDAESAIAGEEFYFDDWKVGACVAGTQKCICSPPGLSLVTIGEEAWRNVERNGRTGFYFDLHRYAEYSRKAETPFTPALPLFFALRESLNLIRQEGLEARIARHQRCADILRAGLSEIDLVPFVPLEYCSNVATAIDITSARIPASQVVRQLSTLFGINIATGIGYLKEKVIRIGTMGTITPEDVYSTLDGLRKIFRS